MNEENSLTEIAIDGLVAIELVLGLTTLVALSAALVSTVGHVSGFTHEVSFTLSLFAVSGMLLLTAIAAVAASMEIQRFSSDW